MTASLSPLIDLDAVCFAPEGKRVLDGVSLRATEQRIGIVGRNGSGKTTLARIMSGLVPAHAGRVRLGGVDVARDRKAALGIVGILFQNSDHQIIFPTVEEEIAFGLRQMGVPADQVTSKVAEILERFDKGHWAPAAIHQLSQGQKRLVCLMSVLVMAPQVIILDEPFAGLDIPTTRQLQRVLNRLEVCLVHITHDPAAVSGYDRVLWLDEGKVVQDGPAAPVLRAFQDRMIEIGDGHDLSDIAG